MVLSVGQGMGSCPQGIPAPYQPIWLDCPTRRHVSMSAPPEAHMRPPLLLGPGHYRPLLAPGPSCTLVQSGVPQCSQGEKLMCLGLCGSRELSQCSAFALGGQAVIGHPSLLSFHVLCFPGFDLPLLISFFVTLCTLLPLPPLPAAPSRSQHGHTWKRPVPKGLAEGAESLDLLRGPRSWDSGLGTF